MRVHNCGSVIIACTSIVPSQLPNGTRVVVHHRDANGPHACGHVVWPPSCAARGSLASPEQAWGHFVRAWARATPWLCVVHGPANDGDDNAMYPVRSLQGQMGPILLQY